MAEDLLKKLKGFSRTFVVHSNANPYAAVAVAGMMAARSQEAGRYFCVSDTFIPMLEALVPEEHNSPPDAHQVELDFKSDWIGYLSKAGLPACGLKYKEKAVSRREHDSFPECVYPTHPTGKATERPPV